MGRSWRWIWTLWKTWINFQWLETLFGTVPLIIFCTELIINSKSTSIMTLRQLSYFSKSKHCSIAISSATFLVAMPRWHWKIKTILASVFLRKPPYHVVPGFPFEAPSMLYFKYPSEGGCQNSFSVSKRNHLPIWAKEGEPLHPQPHDNI